MDQWKAPQDKALWSAAYDGDTKKVQQTLKEGADPNATNYLNMTPLLAVLDAPDINPRTRLKIVKILIEAGVDIHKISELGENALTLAISRGDVKVVEYLHQQGGDIHVQTKTGDNLIYKTVDKNDYSKKYEKILEYLLKNGVDPNVKRNDNAQTALFRAVDLQALPLVKKLIKAGAEINLKDIWGLTPLHYAARKESYSVAETLVKAGADVNAQDEYGFTPLHEAIENEQGHIMAFLLHKANANPNLGLTKDYEDYPKGTTPADIAERKGMEGYAFELRLKMDD